MKSVDVNLGRKTSLKSCVQNIAREMKKRKKIRFKISKGSFEKLNFKIEIPLIYYKITNNKMGDRFTWYEDCPKCKGIECVECYDAPSCMQFSRMCETCGWTDGLDYYEDVDGNLWLLTEDEARKKKLI